MSKLEWVLCPICKNKTRIRIVDETVITKLPLFCPKCKQETMIEVKNLIVSITEPDAQSQSQK